MKRNLVFLSMVVVFSLIASFSFSGAKAVMHVSVPFDFYMEEQLLPAGNYDFEIGPGQDAIASFVTVRSEDGAGIRMMTTQPGVDANATTNLLRFNQYGEKHFLSSVSINGNKASLKMIPLEKELKSQLWKSQSTTTIALK